MATVIGNKNVLQMSNSPRSPKMSLLYSCSSVVANVNGEPRATSVALPSISCTIRCKNVLNDKMQTFENK